MNVLLNLKPVANKRAYFWVSVQFTLQLACFIWGFFYSSNAVSIQPHFLSTMSRIQNTGNLQNFIWCFSNNLCILFVSFWANYFTYGIVGTILCFNSVFLLGSISKFVISVSWYRYLSFILMEFLNILIIAISSTYFTYQKNCKKNYLYNNEYELEKKARERGVLRVFLVVAIITITAATIETALLTTM